MNEARPDSELKPTQLLIKNMPSSQIYFERLNTTGILGEKVRLRMENKILDGVLADFRSKNKINDIEVEFDKANFFHIKNAIPTSFQRLGFATKVYESFIGEFGYLTSLKAYRTPDSQEFWNSIEADPSRVNAVLIQYGEDDPSVEQPFTVAIKKGSEAKHLKGIAMDLVIYYRGLGEKFEAIQFSDTKPSQDFLRILKKRHSEILIG